MLENKWKICPYKCLFNVVCILTTMSLVFWCIYEYSKNEDICEILFKRFHQDEESLYPDLTFCVVDQFNETKLKEYNENFTTLDYRNFLAKGEPSSREQNIHCLSLLDGRKIVSKNNSLLRCLVRENGGFLSRHLEIHFSNFVLLSPLSESCRWQRDVLTLSSLSILEEDKGKCCKEQWAGSRHRFLGEGLTPRHVI